VISGNQRVFISIDFNIQNIGMMVHGAETVRYGSRGRDHLDKEGNELVLFTVREDTGGYVRPAQISGVGSYRRTGSVAYAGALGGDLLVLNEP